MRKIILGLIASMMFLPVISFAQALPQAPASWIAFQQQENAKKAIFNKQMRGEREAFLNANPEVKQYLEEVHAAAKARFAAMRAARHK